MNNKENTKQNPDTQTPTVLQEQYREPTIQKLITKPQT